MAFFDFRQNNSGGSFVSNANSGIAPLVIVEADDWQDANYRAERIGLYWDGVEDGRDCECCGDRWYPQDSSEKGDPVPSQYGKPLEKGDDVTVCFNDDIRAYVHYKDGSVAPFSVKHGLMKPFKL